MPATKRTVAPRRRGRPSNAESAARPPTRVRLLDAAATILLDGGVTALSIEQVAAMAGITPGGVYRHFEDKAALVQAAFEHVLAEGNVLFDGETVLPAEALVEVVAVMTDHAAGPLRRFTLDVSASALRDERVGTRMSDLNRRALDGIVRSLGDALDAELTARWLLVLVAGLAHLDTIDPALVGDERFRRFVAAQAAALTTRPAPVD